jgi:hypothetical protein
MLLILLSLVMLPALVMFRGRIVSRQTFSIGGSSGALPLSHHLGAQLAHLRVLFAL